MAADRSLAGRIYRDGKLEKGVLHVDTETGLITKVAKSATLPDHTDFGDQVLLPGGIDVHVHFREPGATHKEDIRSGSIAAAFGGITGFVDMPNTVPATITVKAIKEKHAVAARSSVVDYGFWAGGSWYTNELEEILCLAVGIKVYLGATTGDLLLEDPDTFRKILAIAGKAGRPVILHCEAQRVLQRMRRTEHGLVDHDLARPPLAEVEAMYDIMKATSGVKPLPRIHVAHIASREAVQAASSAGFSMGVCPHHLLLDTGMEFRPESRGKMNPPLRGPDARDALWEMFCSGRIPILESDHAPHTVAEKDGAFHQAPAGVPGVETMAPLLLARVAAGDVPLATVVDALSAHPAALIGAADRGRLEAGMRADLMVVDLETPTPVDPDALHSKCGWTPYAGMPAVFPTHTFLAGSPVVDDGDLVKDARGTSILPVP